MPVRLRVEACIVILACALTAQADYPRAHSSPIAPEPPPAATAHRPLPASSLWFRSIGARVDNQVIANLLADVPMRASDIAVSVTAGEIARCEAQTCQVPMSVRLAGAHGLASLSFAVVNARGEISDVKHAECNSGDCLVSLILERGINTISVGVLDPLAHTMGFATTRVNATRSVAERGAKREWF